MGLNPLIAARSYIFHVFFILPQELTQEINILFFNSWPVCVCVFGVCLPVYWSWKYHQSCTKFYFLETCSQNTSSTPCCCLSKSLRPTGGSSLPLSAVKTLNGLSVAAFVSSTTDSTQGQLHNGLWMSSHSSQLISGPNPLTVRRGTSLSS